MLSVAAVKNSACHKLKGHTAFFLSNDSATVLPNFAEIERHEIARPKWEIFLTRSSALICECKDCPR